MQNIQSYFPNTVFNISQLDSEALDLQKLPTVAVWY